MFNLILLIFPQAAILHIIFLPLYNMPEKNIYLAAKHRFVPVGLQADRMTGRVAAQPTGATLSLKHFHKNHI